MTNHLSEPELRAEISRLEATDARIKGQLDDLAARREDAEGERRRNAARAQTLRDELRERTEEPEKARQLEAAVTALRSRLDAPTSYPGDSRSYTRARVRYELDGLERDDRLTTAAKLSQAHRLASDFTARRELDAQHFAATAYRKP